MYKVQVIYNDKIIIKREYKSYDDADARFDKLAKQLQRLETKSTADGTLLLANPLCLLNLYENSTDTKRMDHLIWCEKYHIKKSLLNI